MGRAGGQLPPGQGDPAGRRPARAADRQPARLRGEADRRRVADRGHRGGGPPRAGRGVLPEGRPGRQAGQPAVRVSGVRAAVRPGRGHHPIPGGVPLGPPPRGPGRGRRAERSRPGPARRRAVQRGRVRLRRAPRPAAGGARLVVSHRGNGLVPAGPGRRSVGPGSRPRCGVLRHGATRGRGADRGRPGTDVLHRRRRPGGLDARERGPLPGAGGGRAGPRCRSDRAAV